MEKDQETDKQNELKETQIYNIEGRVSNKDLLKGYNLTKENIPVLLAAISGLGALIQLFELSRIDIAYIRFFSVNQLVPDGTLVALTLVACYITYRAYLVTLTVLDPITSLEKAIINQDKAHLKQINKEIPIIIGFLLGVTAAVVFVEIKSFKVNIALMTIISSMMLAALAFVFKYFTMHKKYIENVYSSPENSRLKESLPNLVLILMPAGLMLYTAMNVGNAYLDLYRIPTPEKLTNYNYIKSRITQDYGKDKEYEIRYFNDKYTFIEITQDKSIALYKTDDILFNAQHIIIE